jgi:hypothetical protein
LIYASALFLSLSALALARRLGLVDRPLAVVATSRQACRALTDPTLDDDAKEAIMRQSAKTFARQFVLISATALAAVAAPLSVVWVLAAIGLVSLKAVVGAMVSWQVLLTSTLLLTAKAWYERGRAIGTH